MHDQQLDPSLLRALDALLQERHVSRAAARLGLTQSAMSHTLARLREGLGDPILVRSGRAMTLSPRAERLAKPLRGALANLDQILAGEERFEPATSRRTFRIATVDYGAAIAIPPLLRGVAEQAPGLVVSVEALQNDFDDELQAGTLDLVIAPRRKSSGGVVWTRLLSDSFVSVVRRDHPTVRERLDLDLFCSLSHVVVAPERRGRNLVDKLLAQEGRRRHVALRVPNFLVAPLIVASTDMVLTTPERVARTFEHHFGLRTFAPPLALDALSLSLGWHERQRTDDGHRWFRATLTRLVRSCS